MSVDEKTARHLRITEPSAWVRRFSRLVPQDGEILDLACGGGRHTSLMLELGHSVLAVDKSTDAISERLGDRKKLEIIAADLEDGNPVFDNDGILEGRRFSGVIVTNYLYRPLMNGLVDSLLSGGVLIYETFGRGNEAFSKPRNPDHLLKPGELLDACAGKLHVVAYEHGIDRTGELPGVKSRICAVRLGGDVPPQPLQPS